MADSPEITRNLLEMYGRDDWIMRTNFRIFLKRSGLMDVDRSGLVLDLGCAMGHLLRLLRQEGFTRLAGVDASPEMVARARSLTGGEVVEGLAETCADHFPHGSVSAIIVSDLIHHMTTVEDWHRLLAGCHLLLKPGGVLIIREPWQTLPVRVLQHMARYPFFKIGFLKERLQSFVDEAALLDHFFTHWPPIYRSLLQQQGFVVERDFDWLVHRITTSRKPLP
ncbi:MAG: class I SAM-dependent methyltransferase [Magnetococcales bacterium]|nr:class I SAM-dependent methyltransferase [Magnetococcales bacterium]